MFNVIMNVSILVYLILLVLSSSQRSPLKGEEMLNITQPVLIIQVSLPVTVRVIWGLEPRLQQGERCPICPVKHAEELATELRRARGGARLYTLKGIFSSDTSCLASLNPTCDRSIRFTNNNTKQRFNSQPYIHQIPLPAACREIHACCSHYAYSWSNERSP